MALSTKAVTVDPNNPNKLSPRLRPTAATVLQDVKAVESQFSRTGKEQLLQRVKALSVSLKEVEERSKDQEQHTDETKAACKEVTSTLSSTPTPKCSDQEHQDHKKIVNQPQTSSPNQNSKKRSPWHDTLCPCRHCFWKIWKIHCLYL